MLAMILERKGAPLRMGEIPIPLPGPGQVRIRITACAVCRTDLHVVDGELQNPKLPLIPGHEIVGRVEALGQGATGVELGDRVGVPWLGWTCGKCRFCSRGRENLCEEARFTGYTVDGGYAQYTVADARFCFPLPPAYSDVEVAPFLCAGLIGYRCLVKAGDAQKLGIYGFGAAAHLVAQLATFQGRQVFAFVRPGDTKGKAFARSLGACWAGDSDQTSPEELDAALIFAPVGALVPIALKALRKGGVVVCGGIHMSDIPTFPYELLWGEREVVSVANLTREDGRAFMSIAPKVPVRTSVQTFDLSLANEALDRLRAGEIEGAAVLIPE